MRWIIYLILFVVIGSDISLAFPITDAAGTHALTYLEGQVASETVGGQTIGKTYDNVGRVTQISLPGNASVSYTYAANGTLATVTTAGKGTGKWSSYDAASGRPTSFSLGAVSTATAIDSLGRVTNQSSTSSSMGTFSYASSFDTDGHCNSQTTPAGIITYGYDATKGWLHLVSGAENFTYNFDEAGRLQGSTDYYPTSITNPVNIIVTGTVAPTSTVTINAAAVSN